MSDIDLDQAQTVVAAALKKAEEISTLMNVTVIDAGGNLKAFARMDGAWLGRHRYLRQESPNRAVLRHGLRRDR